MRLTRRFHRRQALLTWFVVALLVLLQVQLLPNFSLTEPAETAKTDTSAISAQYANLPLAFEPNQGQVDGNVSYLVHHGQATTYFDGLHTTTTIGDDHVTMSLDGATTPNFVGADQLESKTNYFIGNDQSKWHSDIPNYKQILATNVYPGIDLKYYGTNSQLEHDFIVNPGSDYKQIAFHFDGQQDVSLDGDGNLILKTESKELHLNAPITYQLGEHEKHTIPSKFELNDNSVTVALNGGYDHSRPLIIDPTLALIYSTYLGGSGTDVATKGAVDASGNSYLTGYTSSTNFPTSTPFQASIASTQDVFVAKLNAAGSALVYSTYLGGNGNEIAWSIAVDILGNAYVAGQTSSTNFPTASPIQASNGGGFQDAFITKLNASGSSLAYATYLGGSGSDNVNGIAIDSLGAVYLTGYTFSTNFPTSSPIQASNAGSYDAIISKINPAGSALVYSTYFGGSGSDQAGPIKIDQSGNVYISGQTQSSNFPTNTPYQASLSGAQDAFLVKVNSAGSATVYSTYFGGSGVDEGRMLALDSSSNAYLLGVTTSTNLPTASPYQASNGGGSKDAFVTKFNTSASSLTYSTYLGGSADEEAFHIALDAAGEAYVTGMTASSNFPVTSAYQATYGGGTYDAYLVKLSAAGSSALYSTFIGGSGEDAGDQVTVGLNGDAYLAGYTTSSNFPTFQPYQASNAGGFDAYMLQLTEHNVNLTATVNPTLTFTVGSTSCSLGTLSVSQTQFCTYALTAATNGTSGYMISYLPVATLTSGGNTITALSSLTASTLATEQFGINLRANTAVGSHTATNFGTDVSGGSGSVVSAYNTANSFKLVTAGDTIATAGSPSLTSTYTVSTIANISSTTEAGAYTTTLTYNIVAGY